ncbi:MAG: type VI secretion system tip protein VgrG [Gemmatimonadaceae bacterium]
MSTYTQNKRPLRIDTPAGTDVLLLERLSGQEGVSMPFHFTVELLSEQPSVSAKKLLRHGVGITIDLPNGAERHFHGIVNRFTSGGRNADGLTRYRAEVVPWLWLLQLTTDCRIFQNMSATEIVEKIFKENGFTDYKLKVMAPPPKREYCVQYRETAFNFISRLMEEEGIWYFFEHERTRHVMVIADNNSAFAPCPHADKLNTVDKEGLVAGTAVVTELSYEDTVCSGSVSIGDYNYEQPNRLLRSTVTGEQKGELYDYPGGFQAKDDGDRLARIRMEEAESLHLMVFGASNVAALTSGFRFLLRDTNETLAVLSVTHDASNPYSVEGSGEHTYTNSFEAIPHATPYRPAREAEAPLVHGSQTAVVTGKAGEEIWVDKLGRVKVQFFWDRQGKKDDASSCWVRVASTWAGKNWGFIAIPRIGQEVIVDFLEGDPDLPIITGRVYNGEQNVPYELPANQTQSGTKSRSTKGGGADNFNQLRFEDKKGSEQVYLHCEKDLLTLVESSEVHTVGYDRTTTIENNEERTVTKGHEKVTIKTGDKTLQVQTGNHKVTIDQGDQHVKVMLGNQKIEVDTGNHDLVVKQGHCDTHVNMGNHVTKLDMGNKTTKCSLGKSEEEAMQSIELKVGQSSIKIDQMGVTIKGMMIKIEGQVQTEVKGLMTKIDGTAMLMAKGGITMIN